jgi:hypothetical protein
MRRQAVDVVRIGMLVVAGLASACRDDEKVCPEAACEKAKVPQHASSCAIGRGERLLLDNYAVEPFQFEAVQNQNGSLVSPGAFAWIADPSARRVVCALFGDLPKFDCGDMVNFDEVVELYDVRDFSDSMPREGTFVLSAAREGKRLTARRYWGAACWAYDISSIIGATVLEDVAQSQLPNGMRVPEECGTDGAACYSVAIGRPGVCGSNRCFAYCDERLVCADEQVCGEGGLCTPKPDGGP